LIHCHWVVGKFKSQLGVRSKINIIKYQFDI
jgi:hypothetical protein